MRNEPNTSGGFQGFLGCIRGEGRRLRLQRFQAPFLRFSQGAQQLEQLVIQRGLVPGHDVQRVGRQHEPLGADLFSKRQYVGTGFGFVNLVATPFLELEDIAD